MDWFSMVFATIGFRAGLCDFSASHVSVLRCVPGVAKLRASTAGKALSCGGVPFVQPIAYIARQTRSSMLEAMEQGYVRTARAKGVSEFWVVVTHALKNAIIAGGHVFGAAGGGAG
jgi:hypothetical protein